MFLITGANGFVGKAIVLSSLTAGYPVKAVVRKLLPGAQFEHSDLEWNEVSCIGSQVDWKPILQGVQSVVHCAARTHLTSDLLNNSIAAYREINVEGTLRLAQYAANAGVRRFVFISSIKVNGESTFYEQPFTEESPIAPQDDYSRSKAEAEQVLLEFASQSPMEIVIIRPPLIYGPGVKGKFAAIQKAVQLGIPLPLGGVQNYRSLIALDNLVSIVLQCADPLRSPKAANQVFVVADSQDVSTTMVLQKIAQAAGRSSRLVKVPPWVLYGLSSFLGNRTLASRLLDNLQVDFTKASTLLNWYPVITMDEQLAKMYAISKKDIRPSLNLNNLFIRVLDIFLSSMGLLVFWPLIVLIFLVCLLESHSPLFMQKRVGRYQQPFILLKFRTMKLDTPSVASHHASSKSITRLGVFLRRTKLDELPQLWNVLLGHMSLVGPRPGLYDQYDLIQARVALNIYFARPGITGLAQVNSIDMSNPKLLAEVDAKMIRELNIRNYFKFILLTIIGQGSGDSIK